jgi:septum formation protein
MYVWRDRRGVRMILLASASPRRRELLAQLGYEFCVQPADVNEDQRPRENPLAYVTRLAREKAQAVYSEFVANIDTKGVKASPNADSALLVLGADTTVIVDGEILSKPTDAADAARMLRLLSGRSHSVATGVALISAARVDTAVEVTTVQFRALGESEIADYVATGDPMDKAGAYGIQGYAARFIPRIAGDYFNVMGLPLALVSSMIEARR